MRCTECSRPVRPVVAVDIDGTLANWHHSFLPFAASYSDQIARIPEWLTYDGSQELSDFMGMTKEEYRQIKLAYRQGGLKRWMGAYLGAVDFCRWVRRQEAELWLTTTRPWLRMDNVDPDTREWLRRNGIRYDGLIYDEKKYQRLVEIVGADRVVAVIDNEGEQYDEAMGAGLKPILIKTSFNRSVTREVEASGLTQVAILVDNAIEAWKESHRVHA